MQTTSAASRAPASMLVASPFITSPLKHRGINYSHLNEHEDMSPLTITPSDFVKKTASFSSNISRLRVKKKRVGLPSVESKNHEFDLNSSHEGTLTTAASDAVSINSKAQEKQVDDAIISACNSFIYFLNDEATKISALTVAIEAIKTERNTIETTRESLEVAFVQAIRAASEVGDFILISKIVYSAVDYALAFVNFGFKPNGASGNELALLQPRIFGEAITSLAKTKASVSKIKGMWNYFIKDVEGDQVTSSVLVSSPSAYELNAMISALASRGKIRAAIKLYKTLAVEASSKRIEADAYTASVLFGMLADDISSPTGDRSVIGNDQTGEESTNGDDKEKSPCWQWNEAVELLDTFAPHQLNNIAYAELLKINEKAVETYIKQPVKHGGVPSAMMALDRMKQDDISPDIVTCSVIMSTFDKGRHWRAAVSLLDTMKLSSRSTKSSKWRLPTPNIYTYALAISTCARCDKSDIVLSLFDQMSISQKTNTDISIAPYTWVYNAALSACAETFHSSTSRSNRGVHLATAMTILEKMEADGAKNKNSVPDVHSYNSVLAMLGQRILSDAKEIKLRGGDKARRLSEYERNSDVVSDLLETMASNGIRRDVTTYSNAISACFAQPQEIKTLLRMAVDELKGNEKAKSDILEVTNSALRAAASLGDLVLVSSVLWILSDVGVKMDMVSIRLIIRALGKSGDCEGILALLICLRGQDFANDILKDRYGINILGNLPEKLLPVLDERVYSAAITSCLKNDELAIADQILQSMKVKEISLTQSSLHDVVMEYCRMAMESSREEYKIARIAKRNGHVNPEFPELLEPIYITSHARSKAALAVLKAVNEPSRKLLSAVTKACAASGLWQESRSMLRRMHRAAIQELRKSTSPAQAAAIAELPKLHRYILKFCAKGGYIIPALNYADDIQYLAQQVRLHRKSLGAKQNSSTKSTTVSMSSILLSDKAKKKREQQPGLAKVDAPQILGRPIGLTGLDWKLLLIAAWRGGHWKVCVGTLPFIQPYVKETHPKHSREWSKELDETGIRKPSLKTLDRKYSKLESAITAAVLCFEVRSQYAWAIRAIEDWIEWSGRRPPRQAVIAACRVLAKRYRGTEVLNLVSRVLCMNEATNATTEDASGYTYEKAIYVESITALHQSGLYDDADHLYANGVRQGHLLPAVIHDASIQELTLDLHGMSAAVAHAAVRVSIQQEMSRLQPSIKSTSDITWSKNLIIITGRGLRSGQKFKPVLRPEVQRMLTEEFFPPLGSSTMPGNLGALTVQSEDVVAWLNHQQLQKGERLLMVADALRGISSGARLERAIMSSGSRLEKALRRKLQESQEKGNAE
ncbi:hypothetical protein ACHAXN_008707 [Cyclotella atomus]